MLFLLSKANFSVSSSKHNINSFVSDSYNIDIEIKTLQVTWQWKVTRHIHICRFEFLIVAAIAKYSTPTNSFMWQLKPLRKIGENVFECDSF